MFESHKSVLGKFGGSSSGRSRSSQWMSSVILRNSTSKRFKSSSSSSRDLNTSGINKIASRGVHASRPAMSKKSFITETAEGTLVKRLEEVLVLELCKDGSRAYLNLTVRGLYKHVIACITGPRATAMTAVMPVAAPSKGGQLDLCSRISKQHESLAPPGQPSDVGKNGCPKSPVLTYSHVQLNLTEDARQSIPSIPTLIKPSAPFSSKAENYEKSPMIHRSLFALPPSVASSTNSFTSTSIPSMPKSIRRQGRSSTFSGLPPLDNGTSTTDAPVHISSIRSIDLDLPQQQVTYRERLGAYIHPRDMRRLVTPFSPSNEPELIVRRHVMLLNFDPLRAIILRDRLLVLVPDGADSILAELEQRVRGGAIEVENSIFGSDVDEPDDVNVQRLHRSDVDNVEALIKSVANSGHNELRVDQLQHDHSQVVSDESCVSFTGNASFHSQSDKIPTLPSENIYSLTSILKVRQNGKNELFSTGETKNSNGNESFRKRPTINQYENSEGVHPNQSNKQNNLIDDDSSFNYENNDDDSEWDELEGRGWIDLPFELQCVDAVLYVVGSILAEDTEQLLSLANDCIETVLTHDAGGGSSEDPLSIIRSIKDAVRELQSRVKGFVQSMNRVLDEDEDMALMNLSRLLTHPSRFIQPVPQAVLEEESDEPELILEANLQIALTLINSLDLIKGQIDTASELVDQKLDALRNRLLFANMVISIFTLIVGTGALVGSMFGMNVPNHQEDDPTAFKTIVICTLFGSVIMGIFSFLVLMYTGTLPKTSISGRTRRYVHSKKLYPN